MQTGYFSGLEGAKQADPDHPQRLSEEKQSEQAELKETKTSGSTRMGCSRLKDAANAISKSGRSIYTLAVVSGNNDAVKWVDKFVRNHFDKEEVIGNYSTWSKLMGITIGPNPSCLLTSTDSGCA